MSLHRVYIDSLLLIKAAMYTLKGLYIHSRESLCRLCGLWVEFTGTLHGVYIEYVHCSRTLYKLVGECQIQSKPQDDNDTTIRDNAG
jgi:hypothetical protein